MHRIGELAAFCTAICWTTGAIFFEQGLKRIGVLSVNFIKVIIASILLSVTAAFMRGMPLPVDAPLASWIYLSLSGLIGFVITDIFLFSAYSTVGPRIAMLFMALSPPMTAGIAYLFLGESLGKRGLFGMVFVIIGIFVTVFGKQSSLDFLKIAKDDRRGYLFASIASFGQSMGMNLAKLGIADYNVVSGTQIRAFTAIIGFGLVSLVFDRGKGIRKAFKSVEGLKNTAIGAVFGPFLGVTLSIFAIQRIRAGIVSTFIGLTPILIIFPELLILKKKIKPLEIAGAVIAVAGTAIFFL
jgi:drug/metabolite transporter (DMT)-like permease